MESPTFSGRFSHAANFVLAELVSNQQRIDRLGLPGAVLAADKAFSDKAYTSYRLQLMQGLDAPITFELISVYDRITSFVGTDLSTADRRSLDHLRLRMLQLEDHVRTATGCEPPAPANSADAG